MAIANSDGSIILSTKVDTSGINKGMSQMQGKATSLTKTFSKLGAAIASAFAIQKIIQFSNETAKLATQTEASVQRLIDIYGSASDSVGDFIDANARALGMSRAAAASFSSVYGNLFSVWADQATNAELTNRYLNMTAVVASKTGRTVEDVQERVRSGLLGNTEAIEDLGIFVNVKTIEMTDAFQRMANGKSWEQLDAYTQQQIRSMAILEQATAKYGDEVADTSATIRNRFNAAYQDFQNSWGNIVNTVLLPVLETLTQIFDIATKGLNALSGRSGQILENVELQEENTDKTAENIEEQTKNQKALNKEVKKTLAGFDDIQILSSQTADNTSGGSQGAGSNSTNTSGESIIEIIDSDLAVIMAIVGASLAAIGIILVCFGQILWGISFIVAGASIFGVSRASQEGEVNKEVQRTIDAIMAIGSVLLLVVGIILVCTGVGIPLGIGMIISGAAGLVTVVALNWDAITGKISNFIEENKALVLFASAGLLVLGLILTLSAAGIALGIPLIIAGLGGIVSAVPVDWDYILGKIKSVFKDIKEYWDSKIKPAISSAFTDLWENKLKPFFEEDLGPAIDELKSDVEDAWNYVIKPIINEVAFMLKWLWNYVIKPYIVDNLSRLKEDVIVVFNTIGAVILGFTQILSGVITFLTGVFTRDWQKAWEGIGDIVGGTFNIVVSVIEGTLNLVINGINQLLERLNDVTSTIGDKIGLDLDIKPIKEIKLPRLAQGAVIPPNREFLAVLGDQKQGTNIEAPLQTIVDAFNIALQGNANYGGGNTEVVLEIDGREFGRAIVEQGNRENRRIGTRLVMI